jgi:alkylation response protein AidB-like acyl-CoA dehydrogenase
MTVVPSLPDDDIAEFRDEVRTWLHENQPGEPPPLGSQEVRAWSSEWQRRQYDAGWAGIDWPAEYGGRGLSFLKQIVWFEEYVQSGLPIGRSCFVVALAHAGPTLIARGSDEHKARYLPPILRGEEPWCQGFSEPGSGSDLASLSTRAEIDGDELVVNGQKVWTSYAHLADFQELLVRTDPSVPKHTGITWAICDMRSPGIEVRPIRTIDGGAHFSEVFYEDVRIPLTNVVGAIGFTVEHDAGLYARRAHMLEYALGGQATAAPEVLAPDRHRYGALQPAVDDWFAVPACT